MQDLVEFIIKSIVNNPDDVSVSENREESADGRVAIIYTVTVNPNDIGTVIGKSGRTIKSIRNIIKIKGIKDGVYVDVKLYEPEVSE